MNQPAHGPDQTNARNRPEIIVASKGERFAPGTLTYALGVAERLGADILAVSVNTLPQFDEAAERERTLRFASHAAASAEELKPQARSIGVALRHLCRKGKVREVLSDLLHQHRHVSFVLVEKDIPLADVARDLPVQVFTVDGARDGFGGKGSKSMVPKLRTFGATTVKHDNKGVHAMATDTSKKQARTKALLFGVLSAAIYGTVFANSGLVMEYFTKGGLFNVLPVLTVFAVSYVHGSFASNVWTAMGVNASRKTVSSTKEAPARKTQRPRATVQA